MHLSATASAKRVPNPATCRQLFDDQVSACHIGFIKANSCDIDELSTDDDALGGHYNASLLAVASNWIEENAEAYYSLVKTMSVVATHDLAAPITRKRSGGTQNPKIAKPKTLPYFPFTVFG